MIKQQAACSTFIKIGTCLPKQWIDTEFQVQLLRVEVLWVLFDGIALRTSLNIKREVQSYLSLFALHFLLFVAAINRSILAVLFRISKRDRSILCDPSLNPVSNRLVSLATASTRVV